MESAVGSSSALVISESTRLTLAADSVARRVLIVDDNRYAAESLEMLLEFEGHEIYKAHDGADAVETAERLRLEVILMDIGLPIVNGYEACRRIRAQACGAAIVMVAITGWGRKTIVSSRARPVLTCT